MPRLSASREMAEPPPRAARAAGSRAKARKPVPLQDRMTAHALFFRRVRRSVKPGLWTLGGVFVVIIGSEIFREIPAIGPVVSPVGSARHDFGDIAAAFGLRITSVQINGAETTPLPVIQAALGVRPGDPILGFSLMNAQARIEQLGPIQTAVVAGGPRLGDFESGVVATLVSPTFAVVSGGLASMAVAAVMTVTMPAFWRLRLSTGDPDTSPSAATEPGPDDGVLGI